MQTNRKGKWVLKRICICLLSVSILSASFIFANADTSAQNGEFIYMSKANYFYKDLDGSNKTKWEHYYGDAIQGLKCTELGTSDTPEGVRYEFATLNIQTEFSAGAAGFPNGFSEFKIGGYDKTVNMDGLELAFANFKPGNIETDPSKNQESITILMSNGSCNDLLCEFNGALALVLDGKTGSLTAYSNGNRWLGPENSAAVISNSKLLTTAQLADKEFKIRLNKYASGTFKVTVTVEGEELTGIIPSGIFNISDNYAGKIKDTSNVHVALSNSKFSQVWSDSAGNYTGTNTATDFDAYSVDFIGLREGVTDAVDSDAIYMSRQNFNSNGTWEMKHSNNGVDFYNKGLVCTELGTSENPAGVRYEFGSLSADIGEFTSHYVEFAKGGYAEKVNLKALELNFSGLTAADKNTDPGKDDVIIMLSGHEATSNQLDGAVALVLNPVNGTLTAIVGGHEWVSGGEQEITETVITDEYLKFENLQNREFTVALNKQASGDYKVKLYVGSHCAEGTITSKIFEVSALFPNGIKDGLGYIYLANARRYDTPQTVENMSTYGINFIRVNNAPLADIAGDVDLNGEVNAVDLALLRKAILMDETPYSADVNKDGAVDILDLISAKKKVVK